ncbi:hypothetical protein F2P56_025911 [Juglans regia]|uniref:Cyclin-dependent protein kinase inhibitor SMR6-like n=1 Tax=Juglans regia TaxID=51240 RepID=A0A833UDY3_JUGRE|nr:hypothetical protein F2P56_025911 [Juglans regia]
MGLEIVEEFRPVTPIRTVPRTRSFDHALEVVVVVNPDETKEHLGDEDHQECHTPKSSEHTLKSPLVCPPAPKKPRMARRKMSPTPKRFFEVPHDLASIFMALDNKPSKKIRAS